ncbi:uncharacterized protein I303_100456 [Kwoniella dejecticola CBS 10117]|uniref:Uncharacterized protein n=1 Tax=Kwoniella dejecticola CBS 10117 TaxID=1296121 RepID=A0A1A6AF13_9TREE|nr:uncharacterized protein I303_00456 [Kwoniella dejecticola CBS 10117]OBR88639.1 hypothetical protein I303_00456 [Kwoniella dejecticola CBS 10117]
MGFTAHFRPLPVERSQGSVSALVARFQTAANRDAEATARENRRASLQPSASAISRRTSSNTGETGAGLGVGVEAGAKEGGRAPPKSELAGQAEEIKDGDAKVMVPTEGVEDAKGETGTGKGKAGNKSEKVGHKLENLNISDKKAEEGSMEKTKDGESDSPSRPPKSPKRVSNPNVMSALPIPNISKNTSDSAEADALPETEENHKAKSDTPKSRLKSTNGKPEAATATVKGKADPSSSTPSKSDKPTSSGVASAGKPTSRPDSKSSPAQSKSKTLTTSTPTNAAKPRTRLPSGPSSTPARSRTLLGHQTHPDANATPNSKSNSTSRTPSSTTASATTTATATRTPKPLVPSHTGPARQPRPASSAQAHTQGTPSPLKPQITGTPSKPTASSLAKARIPSGPLSTPPSSTTRSTKRESLSLGRASGSTARSSNGIGRDSLSPSPGPASHARLSSSGSGGSRLLQGTAASRARAAGVQHHDSPSSTPSTSKTNKMNANTPTGGKTASDSSTRAPASIQSQGRTPSSQARIKTPSSTSTSRVRVKPQVENTPSRVPKDFSKTPAVGRSPIGRLGLAAANVQRPAGPASELGSQAKEDGKIPDEDVKEELQELTEPKPTQSLRGDGNGDNARDEVIEEPVERPKTPSPDDNQQVEQIKEDEQPVLGNNMSQDLEVGKENMGQSEVEEKTLDAGEESLEEIPDIE